jgi:LmbE family N-acetylglucosaminyl deacetylase
VSLLFAPHPDDESIVGALPLRLLREGRHRVIVVAVTLGSRVDRQTARLEELRGACGFLGFEVRATSPSGLTSVRPETRQLDPAAWASSISVIADILREHRPQSLFVPHEKDQNTTHQGTHLLVLDALRTLGPRFACAVLETEFWAPMTDPNLMVESSCADVADLVAALSFHRGEVERNPYHLRLPAWMADNVRRGSELVGGQGGTPPDFHFATLYRLSHWQGARLVPPPLAPCVLPAGEDLEPLFG